MHDNFRWICVNWKVISAVITGVYARALIADGGDGDRCLFNWQETTNKTQKESSTAIIQFLNMNYQSEPISWFHLGPIQRPVESKHTHTYTHTTGEKSNWNESDFAIAMASYQSRHASFWAATVINEISLVILPWNISFDQANGNGGYQCELP